MRPCGAHSARGPGSSGATVGHTLSSTTDGSRVRMSSQVTAAAGSWRKAFAPPTAMSSVDSRAAVADCRSAGSAGTRCDRTRAEQAKRRPKRTSRSSDPFAAPVSCSVDSICSRMSSGVTISRAAHSSMSAAPKPCRAPSRGEARPRTSRRTAYSRSGHSGWPPAALVAANSDWAVFSAAIRLEAAFTRRSTSSEASSQK
mmetsp:Transcript_9883/g.31224  ORF Transcript_9883/g.31224 Transcript_9883/m.31224 type:complete len:200 (+) Transcript_9883:250-849(+)